MRNQTDTPAQYEQTVQDAHVKIIFGFFRAEGAAIAHEVDKTDSDTAIDIEDEVILLGCGDRFYRDGVIKHLAAREALLDEFLDKLDTKVGVIARFDFVANARD